MMKMKNWEIALLCSVIMTIVYCATPAYGQQRLAQKLTRLHVIANSDTAEDQALKLHVRDAVLESAGENTEDMKKQDITPAFLENLRASAQQEVYKQGSLDKVRVEKTKMYFSTRDYETFSLPAGYYDAVRVSIGLAEGHNWWCVMLPPLCEPASTDELEEVAASAGITPDEVRYITRDGTKYQVKFKLAELFGELKHKILGD